jgi:hypothetical protein
LQIQAIATDPENALGDIIYRVRAGKRWGMDKNAAAIAAARCLFGGRVSFAIGSGFAPDEIAKWRLLSTSCWRPFDRRRTISGTLKVII